MAKFDIRIGVITSQAQRGLAKVKSMFASVGSSIKSFVSSGLGMLGISAGITGMVMGMRSLINSMDQVSKQSRNFGLTTKELQSMEFAMKRSGGEAGDVGAAMKRMINQTDGLARGLSSAKTAFAEIGLTMADLKGKSTHEQFKLIAAALSGVADSGQKATLAQDFFGQGGIKMIEMAANYEMLADEAERLAIILEDKDLKAAERFNDQLENLQRQEIKSLVDSGIVQWLADVAEGFGALVNIVKQAGGAMKAVGDLTRNFIESQANQNINVLNPFQASMQIGSRVAKAAGFGAKGAETGAIKDEDVQAALKQREISQAALKKREEIKTRAAVASEAAAAAKARAESGIKTQAMSERLTGIQQVGGNLGSVSRVDKSTSLMQSQLDIQKSIRNDVANLINKTRAGTGGGNIAR